MASTSSRGVIGVDEQPCRTVVMAKGPIKWERRSLDAHNKIAALNTMGAILT